MPVALVTGASSGLGLEFAKLFASDKHDVVLVARRKEKLQELAAELSKNHGVKAHVLSADLMDPTSAAFIVEEVGKAGLEIEFLVNNAGFGTTGPFVKLDGAKELGQVHCNITNLVGLTHGFLPGMVKRGRGRVLNIGSTAGFQPGPFMATYYASKGFVNSFSEALWFELKGTGVTVTVSCPGATATEFSQASGNAESRLFRMGAMSAGEVASAAYQAMHAGKRRIVHGLRNKFSSAAALMTPNALVLGFAASANSNPDAPHQLKS